MTYKSPQNTALLWVGSGSTASITLHLISEVFLTTKRPTCPQTEPRERKEALTVQIKGEFFLINFKYME